METILGISQVLIAIAMIAIILVQRGPGAAAGSGFGAGASGTVFGSRGSASFLTRTTGFLAAAFFVISMGMAVLASRTLVANTEVDLGVMSGADQATSDGIPPAPEIGVSDIPELPGMNPTDVESAVDAIVDDVPEVPVGSDPATGESAPEGEGGN